MSAPNTQTWSAWEDRRPGPPSPRLHVTGEVETTRSSLVPVLTPTVPQGINEKILFLDLTIEDTGGIGTDDVAFRKVAYECDVTEGQHTHVEIKWEGVTIVELEVEITH